MKLHHFFYTKLACKEDSPWGYADWHFVFYPLQFLDETSRQEILKRLHYAQQQVLPEFQDKVSFFPLNIQGESCLVLIYFFRKPDALDYAGRADCFLCHGFIIPQTIYQQIPSPLELFDIIKPHLFLSREQAFESPLVNRSTGDLQPVPIEDETLNSLINNSFTLRNEFEARLTLLFRHGAGILENMPPVLLQGENGSVNKLIGTIYPFLPLEIRSSICCEPAFDGGNWFFFPLKIVGFSKVRPGGADPVLVNLENRTIEPPTEFVGMLEPKGCFEQWLFSSNGENFTAAEIEKLEKLSSMLESGNLKHFGKPPTIPASFVRSHQASIAAIFEKTVTNQYGRALASQFFNQMKSDEKLNYLLDSPPSTVYTQHIEIMVKNFTIPFSSLPANLLNQIAPHSPFICQLVNIIANNSPLTSDGLASISEIDHLPLFQILINNDVADRLWMKKILADNRELFERLLNKSDCRPALSNVVKKALYDHHFWGGITDLIFSEISATNYHSILTGTFAAWDILELILKRHDLSDNDLKKMVLWAKGRKVDERAGKYAQAFLFPAPDSSYLKSFIGKNAATVQLEQVSVVPVSWEEKRLFDCLRNMHSFSLTDLKAVGFNNQLIEPPKKESFIARGIKWLIKD